MRGSVFFWTNFEAHPWFIRPDYCYHSGGCLRVEKGIYLDARVTNGEAAPNMFKGNCPLHSWGLNFASSFRMPFMSLLECSLFA